MKQDEAMRILKANTQMTMATARYLGQLRQLLEKEEPSTKDFLAATYLKGAYDMGCLYIGITHGSDLADELRRIDADVIKYQEAPDEQVD